MKERWVINRSSYTLKPSEKSLLERGLNFAVSPDNVPVRDYVTAIEKACKLVGPTSETAQIIRSDCTKILKSAVPPPSNITRDERRSLKTLRNNNDIMILPADKGRAVVVMDKQEYKDKIQEILSDEKTYVQLKKDPTNSYASKLINVIKPMKDKGSLPWDKYRLIYPTSSEPPRFYGLPKIHKTTVPLRPIVSSIGSITYQAARFVANILAPIVGKTDYHLNNSKDLIKKLTDMELHEDES